MTRVAAEVMDHKRKGHLLDDLSEVQDAVHVMGILLEDERWPIQWWRDLRQARYLMAKTAKAMMEKGDEVDAREGRT